MQAWNRIIIQSVVQDDFIELDNYSWFELDNQGAAIVYIGFEQESRQLVLQPNEKKVFPQLQNGVYRGKIYLQFDASGTNKLTISAVRQSNEETV
ncbi:MAG: hypothetical protein AAGI07_00240 [Bacteroidota bacterium]